MKLIDSIDKWLDDTGEKLGKKTIRYNPDLIGAVLMFGLSVAFLLMMPSQIKLTETSTINARTFPRLVFMIVLVLSVLLFFKEIAKIVLKKGSASRELNLLVEVRALIIFVFIAMYYLLLEPIGFIASSIVFGICMTAYFRVRKWYYYAIVAACAIAVGLVFQYVLHVRLP